jgi:DNA-binding NarL/FixJ family response regulator
MAHSLTKREMEILALIARAKSNKDIAEELYISDQTVSVHRKNLMRKLKVSNSAGLFKFFVDHELFSSE